MPLITRTDFYREEFLKHRRCLEEQREAYSDRAITEFECALTRVLAELDQLCCQDDVDRLISDLLRRFDVITGLTAWNDPKTLH